MPLIKLDKEQKRGIEIAVYSGLTAFLGYFLYVLIKGALELLKHFVAIPQDEFTSKTCFLGIVILGLLFLVFVLIYRVFIQGLEELIDLIANKKDDKHFKKPKKNTKK